MKRLVKWLGIGFGLFVLAIIAMVAVYGGGVDSPRDVVDALADGGVPVERIREPGDAADPIPASCDGLLWATGDSMAEPWGMAYFCGESDDARALYAKMDGEGWYLFRNGGAMVAVSQTVPEREARAYGNVVAGW